ncbi:glycosyltransferase [Paenibacillus spongiae]|uniref:Glycosyltransferase n=1 Tax=Paenibacillus spongiae TaxID=2909671 RepID=A0ABY5SFT6_9BACL|nr:glycosyltransferase [Paenibacillus spongiae]UVI31533.1 glycosyltransferase [Paenibacillus spongiae]
MKKRLLFIMPSLAAGGGEKSLVNLLSQLDYDKYQVELFLFNHDGIFMEYLPPEVRVLPLQQTYKWFTLPLFQSVLKLLKERKFSLVFNRLMYAINVRRARSIPINEQYSWKHLSRALERLTTHYDIAIGFLENTSTYLCVDKVEASKKIGWVHIDYDQFGMDPAIDNLYFEQLDHIVTVSDECAEILRARFPEQRKKIHIVYNIVSPDMIYKMAEEEDKDLYSRVNGEQVILSIGRLHDQKGFEWAIEACRILGDRGYKVKWYVIGEGELREALTDLIRKYGVEQQFYLLGLKSNPYPFIKQADLYVQPSRYEGKSIAIDEAKIMKKPIVVTNFSTAKDQIQHEENGLIVEMNPCAIADGIEKLINDETLRSRFTGNLSRSKLGTEEEITKLNSLFA